VIGECQHELLHHTKVNGEPHPRDECPVYKTFRDNRSRYIRDDIFWRKDGSSFPVEYSSTPLRDGSGSTIGSVVIFRDISDRKQAEENEIKHRRELAHVARISTMGEMASGMAHELNQPLTAIASNADACLRMAESPELDEDALGEVLDRISLQARRAGAIIQQLRNFVRKELPDRTRINLNDLIEEVLILVSHTLRQDGVTLQLDLATDLPDVYVQHIQIDQVILNLVKNAIEAMVEGGGSTRRLTITTAVNDSGLPQVSIADTGPGMTDEMKQQLFVPFVTTKKDGMGLGLSISEGIITEHGGQLVLDTAPGRGACFTFTLPVVATSDSSG
jgi:C4-dicarboxylate-specific signal transduction histidine kinase